MSNLDWDCIDVKAAARMDFGGNGGGGGKNSGV
jgi:hypothetical protein